MKLTLINENKGFINKRDIPSDKDYDARTILLEMIGLKTAKDFLRFLTTVPYGFFAKSFFEFDDDYENITEFSPYKEEHFYSGSIQAVLQRDYLEIDYLDEFLLREGVLGPIALKTFTFSDGERETREVLKPNSAFEWIYLSSIEDLITNVQCLSRFAAIASGSGEEGVLAREDLFGEHNLQVIHSGLAAYSDFNSHSERESALPMLFSEDEIEAFGKEIKREGYSISDGNLHSRDDWQDRPFLVKSEMSDREIAAHIFLWFMNSLFEGSSETYYAGNTFKVAYQNGLFRVREAHSPIRDLYYELAILAQSGNLKLCSHCGRAFVDDKSRGNAALYCSRSCNTKASNERKERAKRYKSAGVPIENAIEQIGTKYAKSIHEWYNES